MQECGIPSPEASPACGGEIDLRRVVCSLSDALDLVGIDDVLHGKRVALMASDCAAALGWSADEREETFDCGILHDCGVSSTYVHRSLASELEWEKAEEHCIQGSLLLSSFPPLARLAPVVRHHHTRWPSLPRAGMSAHERLLANLVFLVDRADVRVSPFLGEPELFDRVEGIREMVRENSGPMFCPALVDAFLDVSAREAFWFGLEPRHVASRLDEVAARREPRTAGWPEIRSLASMFARIVDAKSPWTARHSLGVARLSRHLAARGGLREDDCERVEIAGLLHDLGKLRVPDKVLDKPAPLDPAERSLIRGHAFETWQILRRTPGLTEIALWAALHHENLQGSGYPFRLRLGDFPRQARIIQAADIFQALAQDRPYRRGLPPEKILSHLREQVESGRIEGSVVESIATDLATCWRVALPPAA